MLKKHAQLFEGLFTASDLIFVSLAWVASYLIRFSTWFSEIVPIEKGVPPFSDYLRMLIFVWLIWAYVYRRLGLYKPMRGSHSFREIWLVIQANFFSVVLLLAVTYLFREKSVPFSRLVFAIFWILGTSFSLISRVGIRALLRVFRRRGYNVRYALIIGDGELAEKVATRILKHPEYGVELLGCLSGQYDRSQVTVAANSAMNSAVNSAVATLSSSASSVSSSRVAFTVRVPAGDFRRKRNRRRKDVSRHVRSIGSYGDLPKILQTYEGLDQIIVALPLSDHDKLGNVIASIGDSPVDVKILPDFHQFIRLRAEVEDFDGLPVMSIASTPLSGFNRVVKRVFDVTVGSIAFLLTFPVMVLLAGIVKVTSPGPIFFSQERVGLDGRRFSILKFRTMRLDAEQNGAQFAVAGDSRTTAVGRFLRQFSLDELPQLVNVICGQMSLVGPRPERPVFIEEFRQHVPRYMLRHKVQAGMTGWAQVHGWRGNTSIEKRIQYDLYYIENWSLQLDLKILVLTFFHGFLNRNAY